MYKFIYCDDCEVNLPGIREYIYKIKSEIWLTFAKSNENLCIACVEERLGRGLTPFDFTNESINRPNEYKHSARLINRLSKEMYRLRKGE